MKMNGIRQVASEIKYLILEIGRDNIKRYIGDSTDNNRALTVNQLLRFLDETNRDPKLKSFKTTKKNSLRRRVAALFYDSSVRILLHKTRANRTDAFDVREFFRILCFIDTVQSTEARFLKHSLLQLLRVN